MIPISGIRQQLQYLSLMVILFNVQARLHNMLDIIIPPIDEKTRQTMTTTKSNKTKFLNFLDVVVLQLMYEIVL